MIVADDSMGVIVKTGVADMVVVEVALEVVIAGVVIILVWV